MVNQPHDSIPEPEDQHGAEGQPEEVHGQPDEVHAEPGVGDEIAADQAEAAGTEPAGNPEADDFSELDKALLRNAELEEQLARRNADVYNLQQEYNGFVKRSKAEGLAQRDLGIAKVLETLLSVLDDAYLARQHNDLSGAAGTIVEKLEQTLATNFKLERYGEEGEPFDPNIHEALMSQTSADVDSEQIAQLIQPGYRQGEKVLRPARVGVVTPE